MKRILLSLLALVFSCLDASALLNSYRFTTPAPTLTFVTCNLSLDDLTTYTRSIAMGAEDAARQTIVLIAAEDNATNFSVSSISVDGDPATIVAQSANGSSVVQTAVAILNNPVSSGNEDVVTTFSEPITGVWTCIYAAYNLNSLTATDFTHDFDTASGALTLDLDVLADGIAVAVCGNEEAAAPTTWTGLTERADVATTELRVGTAGDALASASTPLAVTCDQTGSGDSIGTSASFR